jgi:predicted lipid-binding transport protein (Tim44 family)
LFGGGLFGGIAAGFLGADLFGLLFGQGLFGGMAGFASIIGLLLQVMLVVIVARLIFAWWQRRSMPAPAYAAEVTELWTFRARGGHWLLSTIQQT